MGENKRFTLLQKRGYGYYIGFVDNLTGKKLGYSHMRDLANSLSEENEQLKQSYTKLKHRYSLLHDECLDAECDRDSYQKDVSSLEKENEQLKQRIKEVTELLSEEVDVFSDKATEHDINAYVELKEFDNKDAFYMAIATKKAIKMLKEIKE